MIGGRRSRRRFRIRVLKETCEFGVESITLTPWGEQRRSLKQRLVILRQHWWELTSRAIVPELEFCLVFPKYLEPNR